MQNSHSFLINNRITSPISPKSRMHQLFATHRLKQTNPTSSCVPTSYTYMYLHLHTSYSPTNLVHGGETGARTVQHRERRARNPSCRKNRSLAHTHTSARESARVRLLAGERVSIYIYIGIGIVYRARRPVGERERAAGFLRRRSFGARALVPWCQSVFPRLRERRVLSLVRASLGYLLFSSLSRI